MRVPHRRTSLLLAALSIGLVCLARQVAPEAPEKQAEPAVAKVRAGAGELLASSGVVPGPFAPATPYLRGQVMVRTAAGGDLAASFGTALLRPAGPAGLAVLQTPADMSDGAFLEALRAQGVQAAPVGRVVGAKKAKKGSSEASTAASGTSTHVALSACERADTPARAQAAQWHLDAISAPGAGVYDFSQVVVAVLDSGVAYEDYSEGGDSYVQASSLSSVGFVSPYDFVNDDAHANDDHMHGTHIASLIASAGHVEGVAPGVSIMPVKVLDQDNSGDEVDLIDGLIWAVDNGADVINLSLSFDPEYVPSAALIQALSEASDAGAVLVAASGNSALETVTWPAAHPQVIAVGALDASSSSQLADRAAPYSNLSASVDLMAPGGNLDADANGDGYPDGLLAESIGYQDPSTTGLWWMAGTSQASALVSGAAAFSLAMGGEPEDIRVILQDGLSEDGDPADGTGAGVVDLDSALTAACYSAFYTDGPFAVSILPMAKASGDQVQLSTQVYVENARGYGAKGATVYATVSGASEEQLSCQTNSSGYCELTGSVTEEGEAGLAWRIQVDTVKEKRGHSHHPTPMIFVSDELEIFLAAVDADPNLDQASMLLWEWTNSNGEVMSYSANTGGSGLVTAPVGVVFTPKALQMQRTVTSYSLDLDGSGLVTAPVGFFPIRRMELFSMDGSGLVTAPVGFTFRSFLVLNAQTTDSFGLNFSTLSEPNAGSSSLLGLSAGESLWLADGSSSVALEGTFVQAHLDEGAWVDSNGYSVPDLVVGGGAVEVSPAAIGSASGQGYQVFVP